ncbi:MAG TPA: DUF4055 domain-containing protein [Microvirga sp.]|jgi:hypothetical protein|nr:DUF4055 domain-containing protein [Microvirga sp.]
MIPEDATPATTSADYKAMSGFWELVSDILAGVERMRLRASVYLPKFVEENPDLYSLRCKNAPLTNLYADISRNLASKPFSKTVDISDDAPEVLAGKLNEQTKLRTGGLVDDIDGQGNSLHVFASDAFKAGIDKGISWIFVDHTPARPNPGGRPLTKAEEREQGLRPYWVHVPCERLLAVYSTFVGGVEVLTHARIAEDAVVRDGYREVVKKRVRVIDRPVTAEAADGRPVALGPAVWNLFEEQEDKTTARKTWVSIGTGSYSIGVIPLVPFIPGKRHGTSFVVDPPLRDLAHMQLEEFQQESNLKEVKTLTAFPMLAAIGVQPTVTDPETGKTRDMKIPIGPSSVLFAPPDPTGNHGDWKFVEPSAESLKFLKEDLAAFRQEMRDLGMQPLLAANLTVVTTANLSQKASSAVQAWAILFKDTLDRCLALTSKWLGLSDTTTAKVHTDFAVDVNADGDLPELLKARVAGEISRPTYWSELQRRGKLGPEFDPEAEGERLRTEPADLTGQPLPLGPGGTLPDNSGSAAA